jgi:hypothetical protein
MDLPNDDALRRIVTTYARLRDAHGEAIGEPALVLPTGEFFPDAFRPDQASLERLVRRMLEYAPLSPELGVELALTMPEDALGGGCGSGACGSHEAREGILDRVDVHELDDGYRVLVSAMDVGSPERLVASLARSTGALVLHEAGEPVRAYTSEIAAIVSGFGVLLANGAAIWAKSCGGLRMAQVTTLSVEEAAVGLALFVAVHAPRGASLSVARKHLGLTQREALEVAQDWVDSNPILVEALRDSPRRVATGAVDLEPVRGVFGQWLHKRKLDGARRVPAKSSAPATPMSDARRQRIREVQALLDDSEAEG